MAVLLMRHHKKEKKFGPGPSNGYTSGAGKKPPFWKRNKKNTTHDAELGTLGAGSAAIAEEKHHKKNKRVSDIRPSHETGMTGSTAAAPDAYGGTTNKYAEPAVPTHHNTNSGYTPYSNQQPGAGYETATTTTTSGYGGNTTASGYESNITHAHGHGQHGGTVPVIHNPNPYAEVHHGGFPHTHPESERY